MNPNCSGPSGLTFYFKEMKPCVVKTLSAGNNGLVAYDNAIVLHCRNVTYLSYFVRPAASYEVYVTGKCIEKEESMLRDFLYF